MSKRPYYTVILRVRREVVVAADDAAKAASEAMILYPDIATDAWTDVDVEAYS